MATTVKLPVGGPYALVDGSEAPESNVALLVRQEAEGWAGAVSCTSPSSPCPDLCLTAAEKTPGGAQIVPVGGRVAGDGAE